LLLAAAAAPSPVFAHPTSFGVFFTPDGSDCDYTASPSVPFQIYLCAVLGTDAAANGITGAEFRLLGVDPNWLNTVTPNPAAFIVLGSPMAVTGCNIGFPVREGGTGPNQVVLLYTIQSIALAAIPATTLRITTAHPLSDCFLGLSTPLVTLCDASFTTLC